MTPWTAFVVYVALILIAPILVLIQVKPLFRKRPQVKPGLGIWAIGFVLVSFALLVAFAGPLLICSGILPYPRELLEGTYSYRIP